MIVYLQKQNGKVSDRQLNLSTANTVSFLTYGQTHRHQHTRWPADLTELLCVIPHHLPWNVYREISKPHYQIGVALQAYQVKGC